MTLVRTALFVPEGSSDQPLGELIKVLFETVGVALEVTTPDFALLKDRVKRDVASRVVAGHRLMGRDVDLVVVHRDVDRSTVVDRRREIREAMKDSRLLFRVLAVLPVRMTEAWLLLDEQAIRVVSGNPRGTHDLGLPAADELERLADPKAVLRQSLLAAADLTGRRRDRLDRRFARSRRLLLERLDPLGEVNRLPSWSTLRRDIEIAARDLR